MTHESSKAYFQWGPSIGINIQHIVYKNVNNIELHIPKIIITKVKANCVVRTKNKINTRVRCDTPILIFEKENPLPPF